MLSLDVRCPDNLLVRENRTYYVWEFGKIPDVVIEIVSDHKGEEYSSKLRRYSEVGIPFYVIFDPTNLLGAGVLRAFGWRTCDDFSLRFPGSYYYDLSPAYFRHIGLGVTIWQGEFEGHHDTWLRWCDQQGQVIPTGRERAERERQRAESAEQRADRLAARLRELGIDP
jgi:hypothetical protein